MRWLNRTAIGLLVFVLLAAWASVPWSIAALLALLLAAWLVSTRSGRQASAVAGLGLREVPRRLGSSAVIVIGVAGVVGVLVALLSMAEAYRDTVRRSGDVETAIVMRGASAAEIASALDRESLNLIVQAPGIARNDRGEAIASSEVVVAANLPLRDGERGEEGSVQFRGVDAEAFMVRPRVRIVQGRAPMPGMREILVGRGAAAEFAGLELGRQVRLGAQTWLVVGQFASGDAAESEIWADAGMVADTYRIGSGRNSVTVRLARATAIDELRSALRADPRLGVEVLTTADYFARQSENVAGVLRAISLVVGSIMAVGALVGGLNTMYAGVAARGREIATLRAIGFAGLPVAAGILLEAMLLALAGGLLGVLVAFVLFDGFLASTLASSGGLLSFELRVTPAVWWSGLQWALALGFVGGLLPALHASRVPVVEALRGL